MRKYGTIKLYGHNINHRRKGARFPMNFPKVCLRTIPHKPGQRVLVVSDVHGHAGELRRILEKASFSDDDLLVIVGDILEKGPDSLGTLRYVMRLCENGNAIPLIGNVDAWQITVIDGLNEENAGGFLEYLEGLRRWKGTSFYDELAAECGYTLRTADDVLRAKPDIQAHFAREFDFLAGFATVAVGGKYVFVHGGLREANPADNLQCDLYALTKYDAFMTSTPHTFENYVIVGHWPVNLYSETVQQLNPVIDYEKHIIAIDGGCGIKKEGQLNLLILPDLACDISEISVVTKDSLPRIRAGEAQTPIAGDSIHINWLTWKVELLERGDEFSRIRHLHSGWELWVPNSYLSDDNTRCSDYTDAELSVQKGDELSLICETSRGCIAKKDGVVGWYRGTYEKL